MKVRLYKSVLSSNKLGGIIARWGTVASVALDALAAACVVNGLKDLENSRWQPLAECGCLGSGASGSQSGGSSGTSGGAPPVQQPL